MSVSKLFTAEQAYQAAVTDYSAAMASAFAAVHSKAISPANFDEHLLELLSTSYGEHLQRGELMEHVPVAGVKLAHFMDGGLES